MRCEIWSIIELFKVKSSKCMISQLFIQNSLWSIHGWKHHKTKHYLCRHAVEDSLERVFVPAIAAVTSFIDSQNNLTLLKDASERMREIWIGIFQLCGSEGLNFESIIKRGSSVSWIQPVRIIFCVFWPILAQFYCQSWTYHNIASSIAAILFCKWQSKGC